MKQTFIYTYIANGLEHIPWVSQTPSMATLVLIQMSGILRTHVNDGFAYFCYS